MSNNKHPLGISEKTRRAFGIVGKVWGRIYLDFTLKSHGLEWAEGDDEATHLLVKEEFTNGTTWTLYHRTNGEGLDRGDPVCGMDWRTPVDESAEKWTADPYVANLIEGVEKNWKARLAAEVAETDEAVECIEALLSW